LINLAVVVEYKDKTLIIE